MMFGDWQRFYDYAMRISSIRKLTNQQFKTQHEQLRFRNLVLVLGLRMLLEFTSFARQAWTMVGASRASPTSAPAHHETNHSTNDGPDDAVDTSDGSRTAVKCPL